MDRKNYSFYMPDDFADKLEKFKNQDERLKSLSRSQALYFIVSEIEQNGIFKFEPKKED